MQSTKMMMVAPFALAMIAGAAQADPYAVQLDEASFNAAVGGAGNVFGTDFQGFNAGDDMSAPGAFLGAIDANTNLGGLEVFGASKNLFGPNGGTTVRQDETAFYEFDVTVPHKGIALKIASWDPTATGLFVEVHLVGGFSDSFILSNTSVDEGSSLVFLGITSASEIDRIVIHEPIEFDGGNEEIGFNWVATSRLPGAGVVPAMGIAMAGFGIRRRRA